MDRDSSGIVVMTAERAIAERIRLVLAMDERYSPMRVCANMVELIEQIERQPPVAAIVDIDPQPQRRLAELDPIIVRFPDTRFVLLSATPQPELLVEAIQIGARNLLGKDVIGTQLTQVLGRLVPAGATGPRARGSMITVLSASGGCGATTVAINLASEMDAAGVGGTLLVDLDLATGGIALALGLRGQYGIADVLAHGVGADPELIRSSAVAAADMAVLLSPASVRFAEPPAIAWQNLEPALLACKLAYARTIVDAPRVPIPVAATLAAASVAVLIVMQLCVKDIQTARELRQGLVDQGVPPERLITVVNRYNRRASMITVEQAQRALQSNHFEFVSNDFESVSRSINYGQTLAEAAPRCCVRKDIRQLLDRLALQGGVAQS